MFGAEGWQQGLLVRALVRLTIVLMATPDVAGLEEPRHGSLGGRVTASGTSAPLADHRLLAGLDLSRTRGAIEGMVADGYALVASRADEDARTEGIFVTRYQTPFLPVLGLAAEF